MNSNIFSTPIQIGAYTLKNRVVMPPLTRMRAGEGFAPTDLTVEYYKQRASAGLIITEAAQISQQAQGYPNTPGIYTKEQIAGWKNVTEAVHQEGGLIFLQLWHVGRISHSSLQPNNSLPVAPSAIEAEGFALLPDFSPAPFEIPHTLTIEEIKFIIEDYRKAAANAREAGFDGVELHAANGYLIEQFLRSVSNHRTDEYGGSIENRASILFQALEAVLSEWDSSKVGVRLSPLGLANISAEPEPYILYDSIIRKLDSYNLAYLHLIEGRESIVKPDVESEHIQDNVENLYSKHIADIFKNPIIVAGGFNRDNAEAVLSKGYASAVAFGRSFISTPDLPYRLINNIELNPYDRSTFYGGGKEGYTDYKKAGKAIDLHRSKH